MGLKDVVECSVYEIGVIVAPIDSVDRDVATDAACKSGVPDTSAANVGTGAPGDVSEPNVDDTDCSPKTNTYVFHYVLAEVVW